MLTFAILELLHRKPLSGYELKKRFSGSIVFFWKANHSQIYPELKRMEREGLVASQRVVHEWRPTKKVYSITSKGEEELKVWLKERPKLQSVKDEMMLKCFAFNLVSPEDAEAQIRHHQQLHEESLDGYLKTRKQLQQRHENLSETDDPVVFWNVLTLEHCISFEEMYINWCKWALARQKDFLCRQGKLDERKKRGSTARPKEAAFASRDTEAGNQREISAKRAETPPRRFET